jgi:hypothetical protein
VTKRPWREIVNLVHKAAGLRVKAGVLKGDQAEIAAAHVYGARIKRTRKDGSEYEIVIPRRDFMHQAFANHREELAQLQAKLAQLMLLGKIDQRRAMELLGAWVAGIIKRTITDEGVFAPLAPSTIAAKERKGAKDGRPVKPLIDTGQMVAAISHEVESK